MTNEQIKKADFVKRELQAMITRAQSDVARLEYAVEEERDYYVEIVKIIYTNGYSRSVNVTADSLKSIVSDVLKHV